jgi:4-amino-4-deoxy-L-arabinose transferase-like glycosyltransferase
MTKFLKEWKTTIALGALIFMVAFILRVYDLTNLPIFGDEAIYIRWAQVMRAEPTLRFLPLSDGKQPLFMWSIIPLFKIFSDPLFAGRFLSALSGIASLAGVFALSNLLFKSKKVALITSLIYAISPFSLFFDRLAMADAMLSAHAGGARYSSTKAPFILKWYCGFPSKKKAYDFEKYLKSHSGIAFRNKRLI